tara:strand:+ start:231 stop:1193 length:963 start_codon:yes stop_codon:yes gene_type:complete
MNNMNMMTRETRRDAFTLIELLVVISIIALLVGILLPALGAARKSAQSAVCLGNQRSIGQGMAVYASNNDDWLAGPATSGRYINNPADVRESPTGPTQNMDWVSPTLGDSLGLPSDPVDRIEAIFENDLRCPSNDEIYDSIFQGLPGLTTDLPYASYSAVLGFQFHNAAEATSGQFAGNLTSQANATVNSPRGYAPRLDRVGPPSNKIWASEGNRHWENGDLSYNGLQRQIQGGNFMEYGPAMEWRKGPFVYDTDGTPTEDAERLAFRHSVGLNVVYFDGHGENMKASEAYPGAANFTLETYEPWFPTGSIVGGGIGTLR